MQTKGRIFVSKIKKILYFVFILGWIFPKLSISNVNIGIQEIAAILLILFYYKVEKKIIFYFSLDLLFSLLLFLLACIFIINDSDYEGILIGIRTLIFVVASIGLSSFSVDELEKLLKSVLFYIFIFILFSLIRIIVNLIFNTFEPTNFFYGSDSYRIRAPFENGGASSQVPIGYMLALILTNNKFLNNFKRFTLILGAIGTTSRASLISIIFIFIKKINFKKISSYLTILLIIILGYLFYLKSFSHSDNGTLDGSSNQRIELYTKSINTLFENPQALLFGYGLSSNMLLKKTGDGFYESFIFNSLMQGGVFLFLFSILILIKTFYIEFRYKINSIGLVVLIGNLLGGSNYFSMYAYPIMVLLIIIETKNNQT